LVGAEDRPNHIGFYYKELVAFQQTCKELNLDIPFLFHAGETLLDTGGSTDPANSNLFDAVALKSKRIGHGFALMKHPHLVEKFRRQQEYDADTKKMVITSPGICIELCPISNELLHLCRNIKEHPYPELLAAKIPCCVNSDNPSLFRYVSVLCSHHPVHATTNTLTSNSMSHEFYQVMVGAPTISTHSWKQLAHWSLEYSCLDIEQKRQGKEIFDHTWDTFCHWVVREYGDLMTGDTINVEAANKKFGIQPAA
jgi:adenosine deaminase CECR1